MMNIRIGICATLLLLGGLHSCGVSKEQNVAIGGERDAHGCLPSAGQSWSKLRRACIQVFNEAERLNPVPVPQDGSAVISAFALMDRDSSRVEVFLPIEGENSWILKRSGRVYKDDKYIYDAQQGILYIEGRQAYRRE